MGAWGINRHETIKTDYLQWVQLVYGRKGDECHFGSRQVTFLNIFNVFILLIMLSILYFKAKKDNLL